MVEVSPPYDTSDITSLLGVIVDVLGSLVAYGKLGAHRGIIDEEHEAVESAFIAGFRHARDKLGFHRLARIPFDVSGRRGQG